MEAIRVFQCESVGRTGDTWFGAAPRGQRVFVETSSGDIIPCRVSGDTHSIAPGPRHAMVDAAFGRHATDHTSEVWSVPVPDGWAVEISTIGGDVSLVRPHPTLEYAEEIRRFTSDGGFHPTVISLDGGSRVQVQESGIITPLCNCSKNAYLAACEELGQIATPEKWRW